MHVIVWEFTVVQDHAAAFESAYGPDGEWAQLFARADGFLGVDLVVGDEPGTYVTIDRWRDRASREQFMTTWRDEYLDLDARFAGLTITERRVAAGSTVPSLA